MNDVKDVLEVKMLDELIELNAVTISKVALIKELSDVIASKLVGKPLENASSKTPDEPQGYLCKFKTQHFIVRDIMDNILDVLGDLNNKL